MMKRINPFHLPKTAAKAELVSKMAVKKWNTMEHESPFGTFRLGKQDYLFRYSVVRGNFPIDRPKLRRWIFSRCFFFSGERKAQTFARVARVSSVNSFIADTVRTSR